MGLPLFCKSFGGFVCMFFIGCLPLRAQTEEHYIGVKTNAAPWGLLMPNVAVDIQCNRHLSVEMPIVWSPWHLGKGRGVKQVVIQPECRWWMKQPGKGDFVGIHAHVGWFNAKWKQDRYQDRGSPLWGVGISYGYLLPFAGRWAGELNLGAGYAHMRYDRFYNLANGARIDTSSRSYWGITRIGVSIVYRLSKEMP